MRTGRKVAEEFGNLVHKLEWLISGYGTKKDWYQGNPSIDSNDIKLMKEAVKFLKATYDDDEEYLYNLLSELGFDSDDIDEANIKGLDEAISTLSREAQDIIRLYYKDRKSVKETAKEIGLSESAVKSRQEKALRMLRTGKLKNYIIYGKDAYESYVGKQDKLKQKEAELDEKIREYTEAVAKFDAGLVKTTPEQAKRMAESIKIEDVGFSDNLTRALKNEGIKYMGNFKNFTEEEVKGFRNIGEKSFRDIKEKMKEYGINFRKTKNRS